MTNEGSRKTPGMPANIEEFNKAAGLIFAQLYAAFPDQTDIDQTAIAKAFGVDGPNWATRILPSGRTLSSLLNRTWGGALAHRLAHSSSSRHPRSSTARWMRSKLFHQITVGMLAAACQTGVVMCQSADRR